MINSWSFDLETNIFTQIKKDAAPILKANFSKIDFGKSFTTVEKKISKNAVFPTICIREIQGVERGRDLEGIQINAVSETIQVDVITNTSRSEAKGIMSIIAECFKKMAFEISSMPEINNDDDMVFRSTARFRRIIGSNDLLIKP